MADAMRRSYITNDHWYRVTDHWWHAVSEASVVSVNPDVQT
jgi:hypothetical protein